MSLVISLAGAFRYGGLGSVENTILEPACLAVLCTVSKTVAACIIVADVFAVLGCWSKYFANVISLFGHHLPKLAEAAASASTAHVRELLCYQVFCFFPGSAMLGMPCDTTTTCVALTRADHVIPH